MIIDKSDPFHLFAFHKNLTALFQIELDEGSEPDHTGIHIHPTHEILYCRSNSGAEFQVGTTKYQFQRGDVIMIPPNTPHVWIKRSQGAEPYMGYRLRADGEFFVNLKTIWPELHISGENPCGFIRSMGTVWEPIGEMFRVLYEEVRFKSFGWEAAALSGATYLLIQLGRAMLNNPSAPVQQQNANLVEVVISYVKTHLGEKITLEDVAHKFWVSSSTITHLFNKQMGISFYKYVMGLRLAEAKNLISEGMPMEKIAIRVGFGDYSAFYRAFKKEFGISPRQYLQSIET